MFIFLPVFLSPTECMEKSSSFSQEIPRCPRGETEGGCERADLLQRETWVCSHTFLVFPLYLSCLTALNTHDFKLFGPLKKFNTQGLSSTASITRHLHCLFF
ncbi:hypothetical protein AMECASPLE_032121 [Ameca splendens]|uniref:Uncharacterized protein n=1 Tax=Ameca splendens TaxID=208324 RepID=A0ABV0ZGC0_9TELE